MVFDKVREILADQFDIDEDSITLEMSMEDDLNADSLDVVDLLMSLEDEFDAQVPDDKVETIKTVGDIVNLIEETIGADL